MISTQAAINPSRTGDQRVLARGGTWVAIQPCWAPMTHTGRQPPHSISEPDQGALPLTGGSRCLVRHDTGMGKATLAGEAVASRGRPRRRGLACG